MIMYNHETESSPIFRVKPTWSAYTCSLDGYWLLTRLQAPLKKILISYPPSRSTDCKSLESFITRLLIRSARWCTADSASYRAYIKILNSRRSWIFWLTFDPNRLACSKQTEIEAHTEQSVTMCCKISSGRILPCGRLWSNEVSTDSCRRRQTGATLDCSGDKLGCPSGSLHHVQFSSSDTLRNKQTRIERRDPVR